MGESRGMKSRGVVLGICYLGFVSLGLPDALIGVAWPSVRESFGLRQSHVSWIFFGSGCSYFLSSFFAGRLLKVFNVGVLLAASSGLVALSGFNYGLATVWPWFAAGAVLHGLGSGAIDTGLNHYVATHFSARQMNWLHASYSLGAMLGPAIMTACILVAGNWRVGYYIVAITLSALALLFLLTRKSWGDSNVPITSEKPESAQASPTTSNALGNRMVQLSVVIFFLYTGLEVAIGQWAFTVLTEDRGIDAKAAGVWVTIYWGGILAGRIGFGFMVDRFAIDGFIRASLILAVLGGGLFWWNPVPLASPIALALCGLGLAVIFPCLMSRTPERLGKELASHAIGFQVGAAMLGAAAIPSLCGVIALRGGLHLIPPTLLLAAGMLLILHESLVFLNPPAGA